MPTILVNNNTKASFIERSSWIKSINRTLVNQWLRSVSAYNAEECPRYQDYMKIELASAWNREEEIWKAILSSEHIWCQSYFIGESANLFVTLLERVTREEVSDKCFFDLAERWEAVYNLRGIQKDIDSRMRRLEAKRNIRFFFWEEIRQMIGLPAYMSG